MTFYRFNWRQSIRPSRSAQVSAMKLLARPMFLENPTNQFPWSFLIRPPQPVVFVDPEAAPSVFSFTQPLFGLSHLICFITFDWLLEGWLTHKVNSMACEKITLASWGFTLLPLKTSWLRWCQISQIARRKVVPREGGGGGGGGWCDLKESSWIWRWRLANQWSLKRRRYGHCYQCPVDTRLVSPRYNHG